MEKMNLDVEVAKLRLLKSDHQSQHYRLEDAVIKDFPERIGLAKERIAAMERDIATLRDDQMQIADINSGKGDTPAKFSGMVIDEVTYTDKEAAKLELQKPFTQERELQEKESRLFLLNQELDIEGYSEPEEPKAEKKSIIIGLEKYQTERDVTGTYHNRPHREASR
jgi:Asp-tRNA(Asn)/Glu-tRNA(Gln) amidotransferase A subunit family amidase